MSPAPRESASRSPHLPPPPLRPCEFRPRSYDRPPAAVENARVGTRWRDVVRAIAFAFALPALSAAQTPAASEPAPAGSLETSPGAESVPNTSVDAKAGPIVLVLPLGSASFSRAAEAVQAGFLAAADAAKAKPLVIGHGDGEILAAFAQGEGRACARHRRASRARRHEGSRRGGRRASADDRAQSARRRLVAAAQHLCPHAHDRRRGAAARAPRARRWRGDGRGDRQRHASAAALCERVQRRMDTGRRRGAGDVPLRPVAGRVAVDAARAREVAGRRRAPRSRRRRTRREPSLMSAAFRATRAAR